MNEKHALHCVIVKYNQTIKHIILNIFSPRIMQRSYERYQVTMNSIHDKS